MKIRLSILLMLFSFSVQAVILTEEMSYSDGDISMIGYIAYDTEIKGERPGIIVVHEWWGHNEYAKNVRAC